MIPNQRVAEHFHEADGQFRFLFVEPQAPRDRGQKSGKWQKAGGGNFYVKGGLYGLTQETIARYKGKRCWVGGDLSSLST